MELRRLWAVVTLTLAVCAASVAQTIDPTLETGIKPYGSYHGGDLDSVNLSNGNLTLHIALTGYPQRGSLGYTPRVSYNNKGWYVVPNCNSVTSVCNPYWAFNGDGVSLDMSSEDVLGISWQPSFPGSSAYSFTAATSDGSTRLLAYDQAGGMITIDGTNIWYDGSRNANFIPGTARDHQGISTTGTTNGYYLKDTNGNFFTASSSALLDTLGRTFPLTGTSGADASGCTGTLSIAYALTYSLPGFNGSTRQIKVCYASVSLQSNFQASGYYNNSLTAITDRSYTVDFIQSVVLYNGTSWSGSPAWTFEYNSRDAGDSSSVNYGDLTRITLPTGGTISYTWGMTVACGVSADNPTAPVSRGVTSRTANANDGTGDHTWTYNGGYVIGPDGNETDHIFTALNGSCSFYETRTQYYQGSRQTGKLLKTVDTVYQWMPNPFDNVVPGNTLRTVTNVFPIRVTTTWPSGMVTKVEKDYDSQLHFSVGSQFTGSYGNVVEMREFDYANGAPGPLLRRTDYTYKAFDGSPNSSSYLAANLLDLISSVTVYDGNGNQMSKTTFGYDEVSLQASSVTTQHDTTLPNPGVRGNRTSVSHWLNTTGGTLTTNTTYYDTGTPYQVTDPRGNKTTNFYGTGFQSGAAFAGAYVTQVQNALQQNTYFDYDLNTGLRTVGKDANGQITSSDYDPFNRILHSFAPDNGKVTWTYNDAQPPTVSVTSTITNSINRTEEADLDGLGRIAHTKLTSDPAGTDFVDVTRDALGRVATVSNPHRSTASPTDGVTTTSYDALGRVTQIIRQDSNVVTTQYDQTSTNSTNATCTTATDEAGKQRKSCVDGLGRLIEVDEPQASTGSMSNPYVTLYSYDALGNLLQVNQKGDGSQAARVRTFTYDSLSRLLTAANPESGTISYSYDANGNVLQKTSPAPNQTGSATQTISYCYDALNRVTAKVYSAQSCPLSSPAVTLAYDSGTNGIGHLTSLTDQAGSGSYTYEVMGRIANEQRTITPGGSLAPVSKSMSYSYNLDGSIQSLTYPSGAVITYTPDAAGRMLSAVDNGNHINYVTGSGGSDPASGATYGPDGSLLSFNQGWTTSFAGIANSFSYNPRLQPVNMAAVSPGTTGGTNATASVTISGGLNSVGPADVAAAGSPLASHLDKFGTGHLFFIDGNNHVIHVSVTAGGPSQAQDITALSGGPVAMAGSQLASFDNLGGPVVIYQGANQHIYGFYYNGANWTDSDYTAMASTSVVGAPGTALTAYLASPSEHFFYLGTDNHVYELLWNGSSMSNLDLTALSGGPPALSGSKLTSFNNMTQVIYQGANQHIYGIFYDGAHWTDSDYTVMASTSVVGAAGTPLTAYLASPSEYFFYLGTDNHVYELLWNGSSMSNLDLTTLSGGPVAMSGSKLSSFNNLGGTVVIYQGANQHIYGIYFNGTHWTDSDYTVMASTTMVGASGTALTSFLNSPAQLVFYQGTNNHVYDAYWTGSNMLNLDMTPNGLADAGTVGLNLGGFTATACFGASANTACNGQPVSSTPAQLASALAQALNASGSPVSATVSGATVNMTWKATGPFTTAVSTLSTTHDNPDLFPNPSFTSAATNFSGGSGANVSVFSLNYDFHKGNGDNGNVFGIINNKDSTRNQSFTYDALNRLTSAQNAGTDCTKTLLGGKTQYWGNNYGYDAWGNLLSKSVTKCSAENLSVSADAQNRIHATSGQDYQYDSAGNMTFNATPPVQTYTYDPENRITGAGGLSYTYDADGNRVEKTTGGSSPTGTLYWYMSLGIVAESDLSGNLQSEYVFFDGERVARKDFPGKAVSYYFSDHLKTTDIVTDAQGNIKNESDYYPWGGELQFLNNDSNHYKFTGKERDNETQLDYFGARYYSNGLGRFTSADHPFADQHDGNPQTWNLFTYGRNNPLGGMDPNGRGYICLDCLKQAVSNWWNGGVKRDGGVGNFAKNNAIGAAKGAGSFVVNTVKTGAALSQAASGNIPGAVSTVMTPNPKALQPSNQTQAQASTVMQTVVLPMATAALPLGEVGVAESTAGITVLGRSPAYLDLANQVGGTAMDIAPEVWNGMSQAEQEAAMAGNIDSAVARGDDILLASPLDEAKPGTGFGFELSHAEQAHDLVPNASETQLVPRKP